MMSTTARRIAAAIALTLVMGANACASTSVVAGMTNIAAAANGGRVVAVSGQAKDANGQILTHWQAANAIDEKYVVGNFTPADSYGWSTQTPPKPGEPHWIILAFGPDGKEPTRLISRVVIDPTTDDPYYIGRWVRNIEVQVSSTEKDGPYKTVGRYMVVNKPLKQAFDFPPVECRFMRILLLDNHGSDKCVELGEVEIYEAIVGQEQLDQLIIQLENLLMNLKRYRDAQLHQTRRATLEAVTRKDPPAEVTPAP